MDTINRYLDAAVLKPEFTTREAIDAINESIKYGTKTVCVRPCDIDLAVEMCKGTSTEVSCVLAFPHGTTPSEVKGYEAKIYIDKGVNEIDMVANYGRIKSGDWEYVEKDILAVSKLTRAANVILKVIFETCYLTQEEIEKTTEICIEAGADFVKTSTGFATGGATFEAVDIMIKASKGKIKVKPSGGIRDKETALKYIEMGAHRLGTNYTASRAICEGIVIEGNKDTY